MSEERKGTPFHFGSGTQQSEETLELLLNCVGFNNVLGQAENTLEYEHCKCVGCKLKVRKWRIIKGTRIEGQCGKQ